MRFTRIQINNFYNLKNVDIDLTSGTALVVGPNGSGKTNIIKCVQFVLQSLSSNRLCYDMTKGKLGETSWNNEGGADAYIRIQAGFSRSEVWLLCELRIFHTITYITDLACAIRDLLLKAMYIFLNRKELTGELKTGTVNIHVRDNVYKDDRFKNIPESYFNSLFGKAADALLYDQDQERKRCQMGDTFGDIYHPKSWPHEHGQGERHPYFAEKHSLHELRKRILELVPLKLLPGLLSSLPDVSEEKRFVPGTHDVDIVCESDKAARYLSVEISGSFRALCNSLNSARNGSGLHLEQQEKTLYKTDDLYLPCDVTREKKLILNVLDKIFGDVQKFGLQFNGCLQLFDSCGIRHHQDGTLDEVLQLLLEPRSFPLGLTTQISLEFEPTYAYQQNQVDFPQAWTKNKDDRYTFVNSNSKFQKFVHSCVAKLPQLQDSFYESIYRITETRRTFQVWDRAECVHYIFRHFVILSSVQVLPQDRGLFGQESDVYSLTAMETEARLVQWKLSGDSHKRSRLKKVEDALKSLSDLHLVVIDTPRMPRPKNNVDMEDLRLNLQESHFAVQRRQWEEAGQMLVKCQYLIDVQSPQSQRKLRLMVTRNIASTNSTVYSKTCPFKECSGGEIELMIVLAAVYLNDADTVFLDEPGHSLHPPQQAQLRRWLETQRDPEQVLFIVTHAVEMISPTSLKSLYHMSFTGAGFTPFMLRECSRPATFAAGTTAGSLSVCGSAVPPAAGGAAFSKSASPTLASPALDSHASPALDSHASPTLDSHASFTLNSHTSPALDSHASPTLDSHASLALNSHTSPTSDSRASPALDSHASPTLDSHASPTLDSHASPALNSHASPTSDSRASPALDSHASPALDSHAGPNLDSYASPALDSPEEPRILDESSQEKSDLNQIGLSRETIAMLMRTDMRKMFFATGLYLVEGESDKRVLSALRHSMLEHASKIRQESSDLRELLQALKILEMDRWDILVLGGCGNALKAYTAAAELKIPCAVVLDGDAITVKHGTKLEPFTLENWNKSKLCKEMKKLHSSFACNIVKEFEKLFVAHDTQAKKEQKARNILKKHGFWVWNGELETVVFDDKQGQKKIKEIKSFVDFLSEQFSFSHPRIPKGRFPMPVPTALEDFEKQIGKPLTVLIEKLPKEFDAARVSRRNDSTKRVTDSLKSVLAEAGKLKQKATQHDDFCVTGTKKSTSEGGFVDEGKREEAFWRKVKTKFHDEGGWTKIPWEMLVQVIEASLDAQSGQLCKFVKFMKRRQCKAKPPKKKIPQDLFARVLAADDDDDDDDDDD